MDFRDVLEKELSFIGHLRYFKHVFGINLLDLLKVSKPHKGLARSMSVTLASSISNNGSCFSSVSPVWLALWLPFPQNPNSFSSISPTGLSHPVPDSPISGHHPGSQCLPYPSSSRVGQSTYQENASKTPTEPQDLLFINKGWDVTTWWQDSSAVSFPSSLNNPLPHPGNSSEHQFAPSENKNETRRN